jgi:hypothetical protein
MKEEFVKYYQALALKELGYDEPYIAYYIADRLFITNDIVYNSADIPVIKAPLKQQVFRLFREKYSLLPNIWSGKINHIFYGYDILHIKKQKFVINNTDLGGGDCDYDTYEEAENACIDKLIELAKQKRYEKDNARIG